MSGFSLEAQELRFLQGLGLKAFWAAQGVKELLFKAFSLVPRRAGD